ncbi:MAG: TPM domain-containing protein [bacterium]
MKTPSPQKFFSAAESERIAAAIRDAELGTSGEIRVHVVRRAGGDALVAARAAFAKLGMEATARRNGTLLFIATGDHRFAIYGDEGIHREVGDAYWGAIRDALAADFARGAFCDGVCRAIAEVGVVLKRAFPRESGDVNELPDAPTFGDDA